MKLGAEGVIEIGAELLFQAGGWVDGRSDKMKVILNSTQFKLKLK